MTAKDGYSVYRRLIRYSFKHWRMLLIAMAAMIIGALTQPLFAWTLGPLLDKAIIGRDQDVIRWLPVGILAIFLLRGIASYISGFAMGWVGRTVIARLRVEVFEKFLRLPMTQLQQSPSGNYLAQITYQTEQVAAAATRGITTLVQETVTIIGLFLLMLYHSWQLTLGIAIILPLVGIVVFLSTRRLRKLSRGVQDSVGDLAQVTQESLKGMKELRLFGAQGAQTNRFKATVATNRRLELKRLSTSLIATPLVQFLVALALSGMIYLATRESVLSTLSAGTFMSFIMAMILMLTPIRSLLQLNLQLQTGLAAGQSIFDLLDDPHERNEGNDLPNRVEGRISFEQVDFHFPGDRYSAVRNFTLEIEPGQKVALVGQSGSGKSTIMNLLVRFYEPQMGRICLDGQAIQSIQLRRLREQMAYVGQDVVLFDDSLWNNIALGRGQNFSQAQILAAAEAAHVTEFLDQLPQGWETRLGENGGALSGGQRQRIAIARAFLLDAPILLLDEATSALDSESEHYVQQAIAALTQNRTTLVIAHRLSTIEQASNIVVMRKGAIIEQGTHQSLLDKKGYYAQLHALQFENNNGLA